MTIPSSTVPAVLARLKPGLVAQVADTTVQVQMGEPQDWKADDWIIIGEITRNVTPTGVVGGGGAGWLHEEYEIMVTVRLLRNLEETDAGYVRAWALVDAVEQYMRADPTSGGHCLESRPLTSHSPGPEWDKDFNQYKVEVTVPLWFHAAI